MCHVEIQENFRIPYYLYGKLLIFDGATECSKTIRVGGAWLNPGARTGGKSVPVSKIRTPEPPAEIPHFTSWQPAQPP